jgi:hypothetical protein
MWTPIKNVYSPPTILGHYCYNVPLFKHEIDMISQIIGKDGCHFKHLTDFPGVSYIWYNQSTFCIEIWTSYDTTLYPQPITNLFKHIHYITMKNANTNNDLHFN